MNIGKTGCILLVAVVAVFGTVFAASDSGGSSGLGIDVPGWVIDAGLKFINNPDEAFYDFHLDNTDYSPVMADDRVSIRTNFLTSWLPLTWGNINGKIKIVSDQSFTRWMPQVDLVGSYGRIIALDAASAFMTDD